MEYTENIDVGSDSDIVQSFVDVTHNAADEMGVDFEIESIEIDVNGVPNSTLEFVVDVLDVVIPDEGEMVREVALVRARGRRDDTTVYARGSVHGVFDRT